MAQPKSYRPKKEHRSKKRQELSAYATATLGAGNMKTAVALPKGIYAYVYVYNCTCTPPLTTAPLFVDTFSDHF